MPKLVKTLLPDFNTKAARHYRAWRHCKDLATRGLMACGGIGVIGAITIIAFYLFYVVAPMFWPASIEHVGSYDLPGAEGFGDKTTLLYAMDERHEVGLRITADAVATFFSVETGQLTQQIPLVASEHVVVHSYAAGDPTQRTVALGLSDGTVQLIKYNFLVSYPNDLRQITPQVLFPYGSEPLQLDLQGQAITKLAYQANDEQATIIGLTEDSRIILLSLQREETWFDSEAAINHIRTEIPLHRPILSIALNADQRELYLPDDTGSLSYFDVSNKSKPRLVQQIKAVPDEVRTTSLQFLAGGISILIGDSRGQITQWFPVRDDKNNYTLEKIRHFASQSAPILALAPEYSRKGFIAIDADAQLGIYHTTAHRTLKLAKLSEAPPRALAIAPRANAMLVETEDNRVHFWHIENEHPEVSWQSFWSKVWYESRQKPEYLWQSSSASNDFEPKFSLAPLAFGTMKAAFYAMLFAMPLAIFGAVYTAYFMAPKMRATVKPTIEIMEALPTVILGFLAGLWLAPFVEKNMPGLFALFIALPFVVLLTAGLWQNLPKQLRLKVPDGWEAALLMPIIVLTAVLAMQLSQPLEVWFFNGDMPLWVTQHLGYDFDQRNSLVVGIAMGFAVIPTIFSISEDAIYGVPKQLTTGSLALGATPWQTMLRIILLTASPGIFSAVMIGFGRAVGETMIVIMATGNTAIMDMNIFQGFRALSANIAVEMPEAEVASSHYRVLFLAGLVLFIVTFGFNTVAEIVRHRLRAKYSNL